VGGPDGTRPGEITRQLYAAWRAGRLDQLNALTHDDVVVSGYLADGVPLRGREAVFSMVRDFAESDYVVDMSDIEELSDATALSRVAVRPANPAVGEPGSEAFWAWTFEGGKLKESHVFMSRDAAISWFGSSDPNTR
jgi:ketosteroid isomerase-like protein